MIRKLKSTVVPVVMLHLAPPVAPRLKYPLVFTTRKPAVGAVIVRACMTVSVLVAAVSRVLLLNLMPLCVASAVKLSFIWLELMTAPVTKVLGIVTAAAKPRDDARTATLIH